MANTILSPKIFAREVIRNRDIKNVFYPFTNSDYSGDLENAGDTVTVQTLPTLSFTATAITGAGTGNVGAWPGGEITATNFAITNENLVIDQFAPLRVTLRNIESKQSNLSLEEKVASRFAEAEARLFDEQVRDQILVTQIADIPAGNKIDEAAPAVVTKGNVFEKHEGLRVALAEQNVTDNLVSFVSPRIFSLMLQSDIFDANEKGVTARMGAKVRMLGGVTIVETNALTESKEMIMMARNSVNMVVQLNNYDVRQGTDGFYDNLIAEIIWGLKIFGENAKAIAVQYVA